MFLNTFLYLIAGALLLAAPSHAQDWKPSRNVEFIVGAGTGGGNDRTARVIQRVLQQRKLTPTPLIVANRIGAAGVVAQEYLNTHPADAHFLMITNPALLTNPLTGVGNVKYTDVTPVAQFFTEYVMLFVRADSPIKSGRDIVEALRKDAGALSIAVSPGTGTGTHVSTAMVFKAAGINAKGLRVASYKSAGEAVTAVLGGHVDMMPSTPLNVLAQMQAGKIRVIGVTAPQRLAGPFAHVPTWREQGMDAVFGNWRGVVGPRDMSPAQLAYWDEVFSRLNATDEWKAEIRNGLWYPTFMTSADAKNFLAQDYEQLKRILTDLGLAK